MVAEVSFRSAVKDDMAQIVALYNLLAGPYAGAASGLSADEAWQILTGDLRQHVLVAEAGGLIIGTATLIVIPNIGHGGYPWAAVENVVVAEGYRGCGVGSGLMAAIGNLGRELGCYKFVLSSNLARPEAHAFYRRLGWRQSHLGFSLETRP